MSAPVPAATAPKPSGLRRALTRLEVDRAVLFVLAARFWQLAAGPVTLLLIAARFSKETQGFYYTFGSLAALQTFVELGLHMVLLNLFGHAWAGLTWNPAERRIAGDEAALAWFRGLDAFARRWYGVAAVLFAVAVGLAGDLFFAQAPARNVDWRLPWWSLILLSAASLRLLPSVTLLEGCGHIVAVNRNRLAQAVCGNLVVWPLILAGAGLWTWPAAAAVKLAGELLLTRAKFGDFLSAVRKYGSPHALNWRQDVWPLQWRAAVQGLFGYFASSAFTPIAFHYQGPAEAGRLGMTWTVLAALLSGSFGWVQTRVPRLARLAAEGDHSGFDRLWRRVTAATTAAHALGAAAFVAAVAGLSAVAEAPATFGPRAAHLAERLMDRMLPVPATAAFAAGVLCWHVFGCEMVYLRAHRLDPFVRLTFAGNLMIGLAAWLLGSRFGPTGMAIGYLVVTAAFLAPGAHLIRRDFRRDRAKAPPPARSPET